MKTADFYDSDIMKLIPKLNKCIEKHDDYVENKQIYVLKAS
jgi:hypothetical protein